MCLTFGVKLLWAILPRDVFLASKPRSSVAPPIRRPHPSQSETSLPHELLDEILGYLPSDDKQSFRNCSLVAKSWISPSRRRLFEKVRLRQTKLRSWQDSVPPMSDGLLRHIRTLECIADDRCPRSFCWPECHINLLRDYLPFLHQLRHFYLGSACLPSAISQEVQMFSAFQHTVSRLTLSKCRATISALTTIINYFPNLNRLDFNCVFRSVDNEPPSPLSRPVLGQLSVYGGYGDLGVSLLDQLSELGLAFDEIIFDERMHVSVRTLQHVVTAVGRSTKRLRLLNYLGDRRIGDGPTMLSHCRDLQELEVTVDCPGEAVTNLISSVTSTSIRKITFVHRPYPGTLWYSTSWKCLDNPLCRLVDQSGRGHEVEVDFRFTETRAMGLDKLTGELKIVELFVKFREKGRMRVVWVDPGGSEHVVYSSDSII